MKTWLIYVTEGGTQKVYKEDLEQKATQFAGHIVIGNRPEMQLKHIYLIDCEVGSIEEYIVDIDENHKLVLTPKT